jgi:hypothetical protein
MNINEVLTPQQVQQYKAQGYSEADIQKALNETVAEQGATSTSMLQQSYEQAKQGKVTDPRALASQSYVVGGFAQNLIQWQLELDSILERIEHMLRGDKPRYEKGSLIWKPAETDIEKIFNDEGVAEIMRVLTNYVNRNTILSNYTDRQIDDKMYDLGREISDLIYLKYEDFGLNSLKKRKLYAMIVRQLVDIVHSSYLRALHGGERDSLREARQVSQVESTTGGLTINTGAQPKARSPLNPMRWLGGKYK